MIPGVEDWAATLEFLPMTPSVAREIADTWRYPEAYDFYDQTADADDYEEFVTESDWPNHFWQVRSDGDVVAFFSGNVEGSTCEIALGLRPGLTGAGRGLAFVQAGLSRLAPVLPPGGHIVLTVAEFNQRAIMVYRRAGFAVTGRFEQRTNGSVYPFVAMTLVRAGQPAE